MSVAALGVLNTVNNVYLIGMGDHYAVEEWTLEVIQKRSNTHYVG
ncbi:MAG: hypothetical protein P8O06_09675 [Porticoccaceae bacterium]|nr:hypothetical protein [Porticoccaceae bacterium]